MKEWKNRIKIGDLHYRNETGELSTQEVVGKVVKRLKELNIKDEEFLDIIDQFESIVTDESKDSEENYQSWYNDVLTSLYDFGDFNKTLWIDTF